MAVAGDTVVGATSAITDERMTMLLDSMMAASMREVGSGDRAASPLFRFPELSQPA